MREFDFNNFRPVKNYEHYLVDIYGHVFNTKRNKILKQMLTNKGYYKAGLSKSAISTHRLVAETFIPNPNNYPIVNHIDGNPLNNYYLNLEWCTQKHNVQHATNTGLIKFAQGEKVGTSKLKENQVLEIFNNNKLSYSKISKIYNVSIGTISMIKNKKIWKHIL